MIHNVDPQLSQWDVGRVVSISDSEATHIHFANQGDSKAVIIEIENGSAKIPDYLLQTGKTVIAYAVKDGVTLESKSFSVRKRERPENYVYEDDQRNYIYELIKNAEDAAYEARMAAEGADSAAGNAGAVAGVAYDAAQKANLATNNANTATASANLAAKNANEAVTKANNAVKNMMVVGEAKGESFALSNAIDQTLVGLRVFGNTTQDGTPTPDAPVDLVSVGDSGSITVNITGENNAQSMTIATPNGLPGIPVSSGGNYTDANGQQWICDEIDFTRGVYVQRVYNKKFTNTDGMRRIESGFGYRFTYATPGLIPSNTTSGAYSLCNRLALVGQGATYSTKNSYTVTNTEILMALTGSETLDELADYLAENPIEVQCLLAAPIETPLSAEDLAAYAALHTYRDHTTVSNDAGAWMELEYVMDTKKYIDSLVGTGGTILPARVE